MSTTQAKINKLMEDIRPLSTLELMGDGEVRELILLAGKDGTGKSSAIISRARLLQDMTPDSKFFLIDSENKIRSTLKSFGADAPTNLQYFQVRNMNEATFALAQVLKSHKPGDWLGVESMDRIWEYAQDLATLEIAGVTKREYLERKIGESLPTGITRKGSPIPDPEDYWKIAKGAHDGAFFDLITSSNTLNTIISTTVKSPKADQGNRKESVDRKAIRVELGIDVGLNGAPRLPYYFETLCLLNLAGGNVTCDVLRDNNNNADTTRLSFEVPDKKSWATMFLANCRSGS